MNVGFTNVGAVRSNKKEIKNMQRIQRITEREESASGELQSIKDNHEFIF